jgi:DNA-binding NarL/FixJ family response regulator
VADELIDVVIVDSHEVVRRGLEALLSGEAGVRVTGAVASIDELRASGLSFDACVAGLAGIGDARQVASMLRESPVVVCTAAEHWRHRVMAWTCGARGVLGRSTGAVALADAVRDAVAYPSAIQAQLARALLDAVEDRRLAVPGYLATLLGQVARGRTARRLLAQLGVPRETYEGDLDALREALRREGLGVLEIPDLTGMSQPPGAARGQAEVPPEAARLSDGERDVLRLYAGGYSYPEIAARLQVSAYTVKSRVLKAMDKFEIPDGHADVRMLFALYVSGMHRQPELLRRRLDAIRLQSARGTGKPPAARRAS